VPRIGVHGGKHARALLPGLRKILRANRHPIRKSESEEGIFAAASRRPVGSDSGLAARCRNGDEPGIREQSGGRLNRTDW
jgi:hypothetical protein